MKVLVSPRAGIFVEVLGAETPLYRFGQKSGTQHFRIVLLPDVATLEEAKG